MIRRARDTDRDAWLALRNHPDMLQWSGQEVPIPHEAHAQWWQQALTTPSRHYLAVAEDASGVIGYGRLLRVTTAEVSVGVAPEARGQGVGQAILAHLADAAPDRLGVRVLTARIHPDNVASLRLFERAGYQAMPYPEYVRIWRPNLS